MGFNVSNKIGSLFVVATPIGNLEDITHRAERILREVDLILAEDTRHSKKLLNQIGVGTTLKSFHDFNERQITSQIIQILKQGQDVALISDAGTPLISDPGFQLVKAAHDEDLIVVPIPGANAALAALSVAGLATHKFVFEGFLPERDVARKKYLLNLVKEMRTMVFYEAPHRIKALLTDCVDIFGKDRPAVLCRELTKKFETIHGNTLQHLHDYLLDGVNHQKGEFVVVVQGINGNDQPDQEESARVLRILLQYSLSLKQASAIAAAITGDKKNKLYKLALEISK